MNSFLNQNQIIYFEYSGSQFEPLIGSYLDFSITLIAGEIIFYLNYGEKPANLSGY